MSRERGVAAVPTVTLAKDVTARVRAGHPWIYRDALVPGSAAAAGQIVEVRARGGAVVARGFFDADGPIAVRVLQREVDGPYDPRPVVRRALALRALARERIDSDGVRLLHGEGDLLPGLVVDHYAGVGVVRYDGEGAAAMWRPYLPLVLEEAAAAGFPLHAVWARDGGRGARGAWLTGEAGEIVMREGDARYEIDVVHGQKTGFFLDQRENRRLVGGLAGGATVLNLFGYTGGFSVAAGQGGARAVTTVDLAGPAIDAARRNLARNGLRDGHELVVEDCRRFLERAREAGRRWDIVVCDPPSFAPSARALPAALVAYRELNRAAAAVVGDGGLLCTASCTSHVTPSLFQETLAAALVDRPRARILESRGAGPDHPVVPGFPEGRYLKLLLMGL